MKVIKNINNNVAICVDDNGHEVVAMGKGIGFSKPPYEVDLSKIDRTYYSLDSHYVTLLSEIPEEVIDVTLEIVEKGSDYLGVNLSRTFWFSLCDHINFAIENVKNGLVISNPMTNEIKHLYEKEMLLGKWAINHIEKRLSIQLPLSEVSGIALHFINAEQMTTIGTQKDEITHFIDDITEIVESEMNIIIDRNDFNYSRFVTHLKYLLKRSTRSNETNSENVKLYDEVYEKFPELRKTIEKIKLYILAELNIEPSKEELLYLVIHINRFCTRAGL